MTTRLLHNIGVPKEYAPNVESNYNTREEILACTEPLTLDGIYYNVWENQDVLVGKDVTLFVMGDYVGKDNRFDRGMPYERYCDWNQIMEMVTKYGFKLGWHTWSHPDLTQLSYVEKLDEMRPPFPMEDFGYPYGKFDAECIQAAKELGYKRAWSVTQGNADPYTLYRDYL